MAKILRFDEPSEFTPLTYRGLDTLPVYIVEEGGTSYDYFGFTEIPDELNAGRNLLALTGTKNLVPGSEIAIEVLNANGELIPVKTFDHIGFGNRRVFAIEVNEKVPENVIQQFLFIPKLNNMELVGPLWTIAAELKFYIFSILLIILIGSIKKLVYLTVPLFILLFVASIKFSMESVSYTHLTLPTNREV